MVGGAAQEIDPYHVTFGAGGTSVQFSDGEAAGGHMSLSLDVPLIENYAEDLAARSGRTGIEINVWLDQWMDA